MATTRIVSAILDTQGLQMYTVNMEKIRIEQGDPRLADIVHTVSTQLQKQGFADVDISVNKPESPYALLEKAGSAFTFFRIARDTLASLLREIDQYSDAHAQTEQDIATLLSRIKATGIPTDSSAFSEEGCLLAQRPVAVDGHTSHHSANAHETADTIVAVSGDGAVVPNVELLASHIKHASMTGRQAAMDALLYRMAKSPVAYTHTVQDLIQFLERNDLPICDDGCILAFKGLATCNTPTNPLQHPAFVDYHTRRVEQWVGARVEVLDRLVDLSRTRECSSGLHIARRGYLRSFVPPCNPIFLVKVAPEDVLVVPHGDANKVRVRAYHLVAQLSDVQRDNVLANRPWVQTEEDQKFLTYALSTSFAVTHRIQITKENGRGLAYTDGIPALHAIIEPVESIATPAIPESPEAHKQAPAVLPADLVKKSLKDTCAELLAAYKRSKSVEDAQTVVAFKKRTKKSWATLGVSEKDAAKLLRVATK